MKISIFYHDGEQAMEHYDWNDGWTFTPVFDPAIVRPECPDLPLTPVRIPHTVRTLPYNYCNEATGGSFLHPKSGRAARSC